MSSPDPVGYEQRHHDRRSVLLSNVLTVSLEMKVREYIKQNMGLTILRYYSAILRIYTRTHAHAHTRVWTHMYIYKLYRYIVSYVERCCLIKGLRLTERGSVNYASR